MGADIIAGGTPALLHGLFNIRDAGSLVLQHQRHAAVVYLGVYFSAVGMDDHIDLSLVHRDGDPTHDIGGITQLPQHALQVPAGFPGVDKIVPRDVVVIL